MNRSFAQIVPLGAEGLQLADWEDVCESTPILVPPVPKALRNASTSETYYRARPHAKDVLFGEEHAVFLAFSEGNRNQPNTVDVTYADGHVDLARDTCDDLAKRLKCTVRPASETLLRIEKILVDIGDHAITIQTAHSVHVAEISHTSMDSGGELYVHLIDAEQNKYKEGLCVFPVDAIDSITKSNFSLHALRNRTA